MLASWIFSTAPVLSSISSGFRVIILTIVIAGIAALVRPVTEEDETAPDAPEDGYAEGAAAAAGKEGGHA